MHSLKKELVVLKQKRVWSFLVLSIILFLAFSLFTYIVKSDSLVQWDFNTTVKLQNHVPTRFDPYFSILSLIGSFEVIIVLLIVMLFLSRKILALLVIPIFGLAHVLEIMGKYYLIQPGPPFMFHRYSFNFLFPSSYVQPGSAYPSGHSFRAVFVAMIASYIIWRLTKLPRAVKYALSVFILLITIAILISRPVLGEHWPSDVIGGTLLALAFGVLSLIFL